MVMDSPDLGPQDGPAPGPPASHPGKDCNVGESAWAESGMSSVMTLTIPDGSTAGGAPPSGRSTGGERCNSVDAPAGTTKPPKHGGKRAGSRDAWAVVKEKFWRNGASQGSADIIKGAQNPWPWQQRGGTNSQENSARDSNPEDDGLETQDSVAQKGAANPSGQVCHVYVVVRVRRMLMNEQNSGCRDICRVMGKTDVSPDGNILVVLDPGITAADDYLRLNKNREKRYGFDTVIDSDVGQQELYEKTMLPVVPGILEGINTTVFAYGATGAGKTYTMLGTPDEAGLMARTLACLFEHRTDMSDDKLVNVKCSFIEVYNETIRDLLVDRPSKGRDTIDLLEDPVSGVQVKGVNEMKKLETAEDIMQCLHDGNRRRTTEPTDANVVSSRSHAVLFVTCEVRDRVRNVNETYLVGKLSMIDLAGSERASKTNNHGMRMLEGANINRSLLALGNCISALASGSETSFVPYRDSKLTRLLKHSLGGNCRTVMIANVSPCHNDFEDTTNTLKYANRAKNIKTKVASNTAVVNNKVHQYEKLITDLRYEIQVLQTRLYTHEKAPLAQQPKGSNSGIDHSIVENMKIKIKSHFQERKAHRRKVEDARAAVDQAKRERDEAQKMLAKQKEVQRKIGEAGDADTSEAQAANQAAIVAQRSLEARSAGITEAERAYQSEKTRLAAVEKRGNDLYNHDISRKCADTKASQQLLITFYKMCHQDLEISIKDELARKHEAEIESLKRKLRLANDKLLEEDQDFKPFDTHADWGLDPNIGLDSNLTSASEPQASPWSNSGSSAPPPSASALSGSGVKKPMPTSSTAAQPARTFVRARSVHFLVRQRTESNPPAPQAPSGIPPPRRIGQAGSAPGAVPRSGSRPGIWRQGSNVPVRLPDIHKRDDFQNQPKQVYSRWGHAQAGKNHAQKQKANRKYPAWNKAGPGHGELRHQGSHASRSTRGNRNSQPGAPSGSYHSQHHYYGQHPPSQSVGGMPRPYPNQHYVSPYGQGPHPIGNVNLSRIYDSQGQKIQQHSHASASAIHKQYSAYGNKNSARRREKQINHRKRSQAVTTSKRPSQMAPPPRVAQPPSGAPPSKDSSQQPTPPAGPAPAPPSNPPPADLSSAADEEVLLAETRVIKPDDVAAA